MASRGKKNHWKQPKTSVGIITEPPGKWKAQRKQKNLAKKTKIKESKNKIKNRRRKEKTSRKKTKIKQLCVALTGRELLLRFKDLYYWLKKVKVAHTRLLSVRVPELIPVLGSQPAVDVSHKPGGRLPLLSARPAVTLATLKRASTKFAALWTEARWVRTVCLRLLPDSVPAAIWTQALLCLSPAR